MPKKVVISCKDSGRTTLPELSGYVLRYVSDYLSEVTLKSIQIGTLTTDIVFTWLTDRGHDIHSTVTLGNQAADWNYIMNTLAVFMVEVSRVNRDIVRLSYKGTPLKSIDFDEDDHTVTFTMDDESTVISDFDNAFMD